MFSYTVHASDPPLPLSRALPGQNSGGRVGDASMCAMPDRGDCLDGVYCGPYGMSIQYWLDAGQQGDDFYDCMDDWDCANSTLTAYTTK